MFPLKRVELCQQHAAPSLLRGPFPQARIRDLAAVVVLRQDEAAEKGRIRGEISHHYEFFGVADQDLDPVRAAGDTLEAHRGSGLHQVAALRGGKALRQLYSIAQAIPLPGRSSRRLDRGDSHIPRLSNSIVGRPARSDDGERNMVPGAGCGFRYREHMRPDGQGPCDLPRSGRLAAGRRRPRPAVPRAASSPAVACRSAPPERVFPRPDHGRGGALVGPPGLLWLHRLED